METEWICIFQLDIIKACQISALHCAFYTVVWKQMELKLRVYQCHFCYLCKQKYSSQWMFASLRDFCSDLIKFGFVIYLKTFI